MTAEACIRHNDIKRGTKATVEDCKQWCEDIPSCCSVDYRTDDNSCHLNAVNRVTVNPSTEFTMPCYGGLSWAYAERLIPGNPS